MPDVIEFKVSGLAEIQDALEAAPLRVSRRIMRTGLLAAAFIWQREMEATVTRGWHHWRRSNSEKRRGKSAAEPPGFAILARTIKTKVTVKSDLEGSASVGPLQKTFWSMFLEFGTKKEAPRPFIRQAFESRKQDVLDEFIIEIKAAMEREGLKLS